MLSDILTPFCNETGYDPVKNRSAALTYINRGAKEVYDGLEADRGLSEVVLSVPRNMQLTIPHYIGEIRGIREYKYSSTIPLQSMGVPQYSSDTWQFMWRNWRQKPPTPIHTSLSNSGLLGLYINTPDNSVISIAMQTATGSRIAENIVMSAPAVQSVNSPLKILSISSPTQGRIYDVVIKDVNNNEIATLHNDQQKTRYLVIDVSEFQWGSAYTNDGETTLAEVLFKPAFTKLYNDTDEFISEGYDDAIHYKSLEFWYYGQEGKEQDALLFNKKATQATDLATRSQENGEMKTLQFQPNGVYKAFRRIKNKAWGNNGTMLGGSPFWP